jgi:hypothetical protein
VLGVGTIGAQGGDRVCSEWAIGAQGGDRVCSEWVRVGQSVVIGAQGGDRVCSEWAIGAQGGEGGPKCGDRCARE